MATPSTARPKKVQFALQNGITGSGGSTLPHIVVWVNKDKTPIFDGVAPYRNGPGLSPNPEIHLRFGDKVHVLVEWRGQRLELTAKLNDEKIERGLFFLSKKNVLRWRNDNYYTWPGGRESSGQVVFVADDLLDGGVFGGI